MYHLQHDSPTPIHEQLTEQIRAHVASGALAAGATFVEYRAFAQELLTNPQVVARSFATLEAEGVLAKTSTGGVVVTPGAAAICRIRLRDAARERIRTAVALGLTSGLAESEIVAAVDAEFAAAKNPPVSADQLSQAIKKPTHDTSHRTSQGIKEISRQGRAGLS